MAERSTDPLVRYIRRLAEVQQNHLLSDQELLRRFAANQDQAAFTALVRRHGSMVLRVCQRVLRPGPEAEDVFQAAFMVLSRKAGSCRWQESIGKWLYKVAHRLALEAKATLLRRQARESQADDVQQVIDPHSTTSLHDAEAVLDEELERLPESLRLPLVLCCLEGQTHSRVARQLGCSEKTISRRIGQARERLRARLKRRGVALSTALLVSGLANEAMAVEIPALLVGPTVRAATAFAAGQGSFEPGISTQAATLAEGVLQAMVLTKVKLGAVLLMATLLVGTAGALVCQRLAGTAWGRVSPIGRPAQVKSLAPFEPKKATVDLYGDPLPAKAVFRLGTIRFRHPELTSLAFTKDGRFLVSRGEDRVVRVWPIKNGQITAAIREFVKVDAFALDGTDQLVIVTHDKDFFETSEKKEFQPTITVYDAISGKRIKAIQPQFPRIEALCGSPDGKVVYALTHDRTKDKELIQALDLKSEKVLKSSPIKITRSSEGFPYELASRNGCKTELCLWTKEPWTVVLDPNNQLVAETRGSEGVHVWNMVGKTTDTIKVGKENRGGFPTKLGFSPAGVRLAISHCGQEQAIRAEKNTIEVWDAKTRKLCFSIKNRPTDGFAFSPDGKELATVASEQADKEKKQDLLPIIQLWDTATGKETRTMLGSGDNALRALAYSPDGKLLASGGTDGVIRLWNRQTGLEVSPSTPLAEPVASLSSTADDNQLLTAGSPGHLHWWDIATGRITQTLRHAPVKYAGLDVSTDGKRIAAAGLKPGVAPTRSAFLYLTGPNRYEAVVLEANGQEIRRVPEMDSPCVKLCHGGRRLLYVKGKAICCLDLATGQEVFKLRGKNVGVKWFALSLDESLIAAEADDHFLCVWDVQTRRLLHTEGLVDWADAAVDPQKGGNTTCLLIDCALRSVKQLSSTSKGSTCNEWVRALAFAPDGRTLAFRVEFYRRSLEFGLPNDPLGLLNKKPKLLSKVYLLDLKTFQSRAFDEDFDFHSSLAFAPDGRTLAAAGVDGSSIHLYEVATYKERASFHGHQGTIWDLQFAPDNHRLYSVSEDATALVWDFIGTPRSVSAADVISARWADLAGDNATKAYHAIRDLATVPGKMLPLLRQSLTPAVAVDPKWVKQLVAELNSDDFKKRAHAHAELEKLGEQAEPALAEAVRGKPELDFKRRLETLLASARKRFLVPLTGEALRSVRGVELLERIGSQEACDLLKKLAAGGPGFRLTHEAQSSLRRLAARAKP